MSSKYCFSQTWSGGNGAPPPPSMSRSNEHDDRDERDYERRRRRERSRERGRGRSRSRSRSRERSRKRRESLNWRERADEDNRRNRDRSPGRYRDRFRLIENFYAIQENVNVTGICFRSPGEEDWRHATPNNTVMIRGLPQNITEQHVSCVCFANFCANHLPTSRCKTTSPATDLQHETSV